MKRSREVRTRARTLFFRYFLAGVCLIAIMLGVSLPVMAVSELNSRQSERNGMQTRADAMAHRFDEEIQHMLGSLRLFAGFVATAAPLRVPKYFGANSSAAERVAIAVPSNLAGALNTDGFMRLYTRTRRRVPAISTVLVQPGLVNVFSTNEAMRGVDWLWNAREAESTTSEYFFAVRHATAVVRGPIANENATDPHVNLAFRVPIFTNNRATTKDPDAIDLSTNQSPNWNLLWGALTVNFDMLLVLPSLRLDVIAEAQYDYQFEALPSVQRVRPTQHIILSRSASVDFTNAAVKCAATADFEMMCFRVLRREMRDKKIFRDLALMTSFITLLATALLVSIACILHLRRYGRIERLFKRVASEGPYHVVCIDMTHSNEMWAATPSLMTEVTATLLKRIGTLARRHKVHIVLRRGNCIIVLSRSREAIAKFTIAVADWAHFEPWPPHVLVHAPNGAITFSFIIHTFDGSAVQLESETGDVASLSGPGVHNLLLLRAAAIEGHIICTAQFLGLVRDVAQPDNDAESLPTNAAEAVKSVESFLGPVMEIGVCVLPPTSYWRSRNRVLRRELHSEVIGFLCRSPSTEGRQLIDVLDSFPDSVWCEWRSAHHHPAIQSLSVSLHSIFAPSIGSSSTTYRGNLPHLGDGNIQLIVRSRKRMTDAHVTNGEADIALPALALAPRETWKLTQTLVSLVFSHLQREIISGQVIDTASLLRGLLSLSSYFSFAFRLVLAVLPSELVRAAFGGAAEGRRLEDICDDLAGRCAWICHHYFRETDGDDEERWHSHSTVVL
jgi:hypothetical protein